MELQKRLFTLVIILACLLQAQGADKYTDENRPYEFGFTNEGQQHRHEKKDEKGIIMGEFGFITADGVYHVTVYATDENGNFHILSMKNIRTMPYPTAPGRQGHSLALPPGQQGGQKPSQPSIPGPVEASPVKSCSHCSIPVTTTIRPPLSNPSYPGPNSISSSSNYPGNANSPNYPSQGNIPQTGNYPQSGNYPEPGYAGQNPGPGQYPPSGDRSPKQYDPNYQQTPVGPEKPVLNYAQMSIVDKNTDIHHKAPGERDGLPNGLTKNDMMTLLYTFNYTVGFHGHFEEGYTNGAKQGYYFVTGRNGVRTRIDYVADENGFRPKISQEVLDLLSDDVPKPETEKDEKYGLKGYEFKWLYYPVDSKA